MRLLLVQAGRRMMLTPQAAVLQDYVRDLIVRADAITRKKTAFQPATASRRGSRSRCCPRPIAASSGMDQWRRMITTKKT